MTEPEINPRLREHNHILQENDHIYRSAAKRLGLPECTLWILYTLRAEPAPLTQKRLCQLLLQPKQTINSALKSMASEGVITLTPGGDRRTREVILTEKGLALAKRTADLLLRAEEQALADMGEEEREAFLQGFQTFTYRLQQAMLDQLQQIE